MTCRSRFRGTLRPARGQVARADPGLSHASPIVWGDRVYVLSAVAEGSTLDMKAEGVVFAKDTVQHEWRLHALDRDTGRERWVRVVHRGTPRQPRHVRATYANATPATDGTRIALVLANEGLFVLDMEGTLLWRKEMRRRIRSSASIRPARR